MEVRIANNELSLPDSNITIGQLKTNLSLLGYTVLAGDTTTINGMAVEDDMTIPEGAVIEFKSSMVKVIKSVGAFFETEIPWSDISIREAITSALDAGGFAIDFTDQIQVLDYSGISPTVYTTGQLNEKVSKGAILKVMRFGKDDSGL